MQVLLLYRMLAPKFILHVHTDVEHVSAAADNVRFMLNKAPLRPTLFCCMQRAPRGCEYCT